MGTPPFIAGQKYGWPWDLLLASDVGLSHEAEPLTCSVCVNSRS